MKSIAIARRIQQEMDTQHNWVHGVCVKKRSELRRPVWAEICGQLRRPLFHQHVRFHFPHLFLRCLPPHFHTSQRNHNQSVPAMTSTPPAQQSRFKTPSNLTTQERLSTNTVGLVALSDFRKRRAEVIEQQEREAREALRTSGTNTPRSRSETPATDKDGDGGTEKKVKRRKKKALVSFGDDEEDEDDAPAVGTPKNKKKRPAKDDDGDELEAVDSDGKTIAKVRANAAVGVVPRALTKAALRREAAEREALRKEFLVLQEAVKNTEIAVPFVFYDGTNTPGGTVRVRKGEFVWVFLDKSRKVGAELGVGGEKNSNVRREWARVGVDDLLLVRGTMIIPHVSFFIPLGDLTILSIFSMLMFLPHIAL